MTVTLAHLNWMWQGVIMPRQGDVYVFGGSLSPTAVQQGTDCSGAVSEVNEAILYGPGMNWQRQFWTGTFAGARVGDHGPFGGVQATADWVCIADPRKPPPGAVMTVAVLQDPDPSSAHMVCAVLDPANVTGFGGPGKYVGVESGGQFTDPQGNSTLHIGPLATGVDDPEFNQWFALTDTIIDAPPAPPPVLTPLQQNALTVIVAGEVMGITPLGQQMALCCALDESGMKMYANSTVPESLNYPHDAVGNNGQSCGPFQQQAQFGWGTVACEMDWTCSANLFYTALARKPYTSGGQPPWGYIQSVQGSATPDGSNYQRQWDAAVALYNSVINIPFPGDDMAAVPQAEWNAVRDAWLAPVESQSPFRALGEQPTWNRAQLLSNIDQFQHPEFVEWAASRGDTANLAILEHVAAGNPATYPDRAADIQLAQAALARAVAGPQPTPTPTPVPAPVTPPVPAPAPAPTPAIGPSGWVGIIGMVAQGVGWLLQQSLHVLSPQWAAVASAVLAVLTVLGVYKTPNQAKVVPTPPPASPPPPPLPPQGGGVADALAKTESDLTQARSDAAELAARAEALRDDINKQG